MLILKSLTNPSPLVTVSLFLESVSLLVILEESDSGHTANNSQFLISTLYVAKFLKCLELSFWQNKSKMCQAQLRQNKPTYDEEKWQELRLGTMGLGIHHSVEYDWPEIRDFSRNCQFKGHQELLQQPLKTLWDNQGSGWCFRTPTAPSNVLLQTKHYHLLRFLFFSHSQRGCW